MGVDAEIQDENGEHKGARVPDSGRLFAQFLAIVYDPKNRCLQFIDPYGDTTFNQAQLEVLKAELQAARQLVNAEAYRRHRQEWVDKATAANWQPTVIEGFRKTLGDASSQEEAAREMKAHVDKVLGLVTRAIEMGPHTYVKFIGD